MHTKAISWLVSTSIEKGEHIRPNKVILRRDMSPDILQSLLFSLNALVLRRQNPITQALGEHRPRCDFVHPFDAFGEDLSVDWMLQVPSVDLWGLERVGAADVDASAGQGML